MNMKPTTVAIYKAIEIGNSINVSFLSKGKYIFSLLKFIDYFRNMASEQITWEPESEIEKEFRESSMEMYTSIYLAHSILGVLGANPLYNLFSEEMKQLTAEFKKYLQVYVEKGLSEELVSKYDKIYFNAYTKTIEKLVNGKGIGKYTTTMYYSIMRMVAVADKYINKKINSIPLRISAIREFLEHVLNSLKVLNTSIEILKIQEETNNRNIKDVDKIIKGTVAKYYLSEVMEILKEMNSEQDLNEELEVINYINTNLKAEVPEEYIKAIEPKVIKEIVSLKDKIHSLVN